MPCIVFEYLLGAHLPDCHRHARVHQVDHLTAPDEVHQRNDHQPHKEAAAADDEGIFQTDDVAKTQDGGSGVELQNDLRLVGDGLSESQHRRAHRVRPSSESADDEVVKTTDETAHRKRARTLAAAFAAHKDLSCRGRLREWIFPVHLLDEIFPERDEEQYSQNPAEQRREEHLHEVDLHSKDVDGGESEYRAGHHGSGAASDGLDDDILPQTFLFAECACQTHRYDRDRDRRLEHLPHAQSQIGRRGGEDDHHQQSKGH